MSIIKVVLDSGLIDGLPLSFRAPCDCSEATGLKVTYVEGDSIASANFSFADAHGVDLTAVGDSFVSGSMVRVILDTVSYKAFIQNADTNAYLESVFAALRMDIRALSEYGVSESDVVTAVENYMSSHPITAKYVGLGNVNNTSDMDKPVSTAQALAIADAQKHGTDAQENLDNHIQDKENPHGFGLGKVEGVPIAVDNSGALPLHSLKLFGKTTQNGTPSPETPAELVSAGAGGSIGVTVAGKNLLECVPMNITTNGLTITTGADGRYTLNGTTTGVINPALCPYTPGTRTCIPAGTYTLSGHPGTANLAKMQIPVYPDNETATFLEIISLTHSAPTRTVTFPKPVYLGVYLYGDAGVTYANAVYAPAIEIGANKTEYEPYKGQTLTAATPNGLPGIPVTSGGNYTDENGQAWICDEIDFARGVYVQRIGKYTFTGEETKGAYGSVNANGYGRMQISFGGAEPAYISNENKVPSFCDKYLPMGATELAYHIAPGGTGYYFAFLANRQMAFSTKNTTSAAFKAEITGTSVFYQLATPIETALSAEELTAFAALRTNKPNTTVYNDAGAHMEIGYYTPISALPVAGGAMGGNIRMAGNRITDLADPVCDGDAASKAYVDSKVSNSSKVFEDSTYTGCYYRLVDGTVEWLNPPGVVGVAYRTSERYKGYPVWVKTIFVGDATANTLKWVQYLNEDEYPDYFAEAFRVCATGCEFTTQTIPNVVAHSEDGSFDYTVVITPTVDMSDIYATVWYIREG